MSGHRPVKTREMIVLSPAESAKTCTFSTENNDILTITPLGAGCEVGRSCFLMSFMGRQVMFDCGIHPAKHGSESLPYFEQIDTSKVDLCLVTHFHLDHAGAVPYLLNHTKFKGKLLMTHPTKPISRLLWLDYARVSKLSDEELLFTREDVENACDKILEIDFRQTFHMNGITFTCYPAGHVLGAVMFVVKIGGISVLYTGDYSREIDRHLPSADMPPEQIDVIIVEATYGIQNHEPRDQRELRLTNAIHQVIKRGGKCLLPVFALGRAQELLLILEEYWRVTPELHSVNIYYVSPMASKCMRIFESFTNCCSADVQNATNNSENPWNLRFIQNVSDIREVYEDLHLPCVVLAAPGMLQSGASRDLCEAWCGDPNNAILLTGYSVRGTLAHDLSQNPESFPSVNSGKKINVRCTIRFLSFSAHADYEETRSFIEEVKAPNIVLCHGNPEEMRRMKAKLSQELPSEYVLASPENCQKVVIAFPREDNVMVCGRAMDAPLVTGEAETEDSSILLLVSDKNGMPVGQGYSNPCLLDLQDVPVFTDLKVVNLKMTLDIVFPGGLKAAERTMVETFEDVQWEGSDLLVCGRIQLSEQEEKIRMQWEASPVNDIIADTICVLSLQAKNFYAACEHDVSFAELNSVKDALTFDRHLFYQQLSRSLFETVLETLKGMYSESSILRVDPEGLKIQFLVEHEADVLTVNLWIENSRCFFEFEPLMGADGVEEVRTGEDLLDTRRSIQNLLKNCEVSVRPVPTF